MSGRTFYLAAASSNVEEAKARIAELCALGWTCLYDWTPLDKPECQWATVAGDEIDACLDADLFVALAPISPGSAFEVGVRITGDLIAGGDEGGVAHLVGPWVCPFAHDSRVIRHESWEAFLSTVARDATAGGEA